MESLLSGASSASPESYFDLYGGSLKAFYERIDGFGRQEAERSRLFSWIMPAPLKILVAGEYNHGKSALINFLLGRNNLLPVSPKRETKITTFLYPLYFSNFGGFGVNHEHALLVNKKEKSFQVVQLPDLKATVSDPNLVPDDHDLYIYLDNKLLYRNVVFIDTPGFAVEHDNECYPQSLAKASDVILLVSDLNKPFTRYHDRFIKLIGNHSRKIITAVNKVDSATNLQDIRDAVTHLTAHKHEYAFNFPHYLVSALDAKLNIDKLFAAMDEGDEHKSATDSGKNKPAGGKDKKNDAGSNQEKDVSDLKQGEWENVKLWNHIFREISENRLKRKSENWALNVVGMFGASKSIGEQEAHRLFEDIHDSVEETKNEMKSFDEIFRSTGAGLSITGDIIETKIREFGENIERIISEHSNTANVAIVEKLAKCSKKKDIERVQDELRKYLRVQLDDALKEIQALVEKQTAGLNLYWFKILSEIPDGRLVDDSLSPARAVELRTILYDHLFEEQYFWRKVSWDGVLKILEQKGFGRSCRRKDNVAWFLNTVRSCFFSCDSPEYILKYIVEKVEFPEPPANQLKKIRNAGWAPVRSPGFLFFGTSAAKYRYHVQQYIQKYQLKQFNLLKQKFAGAVSEYEQTAKSVLKDIEKDLRASLGRGIIDLRNQTNRRTARDLIGKIERIAEGTALPFENNSES